MTVSPGEESAQDRSRLILTPDQRVRVFISSTLEELAEERAVALRAIRRLHLVPVWFESGARPHPPQSTYRTYLEQSQIFVGIYCGGDLEVEFGVLLDVRGLGVVPRAYPLTSPPVGMARPDGSSLCVADARNWIL
jgi:hypothetical protein